MHAADLPPFRDASPTDATLACAAWAIRAARDVAATPAVGTRRAGRLLGAMRDAFAARSAAASVERIEADGSIRVVAAVAIGWTRQADVARADDRLRRASRASAARRPASAGFIAHALAVGPGTVARVELHRPAGPAFAPAEVAWLGAVHAALAWAYEPLGSASTAPAGTTERIGALSPRDRQTLDWLLAGASEKQAAVRLGLSAHTIHTHVKRIYRSLGVTSRSELLATCLREPDV